MPRWDTLRDAFGESFAMAREDPQRWLAMAGAAIDTQRAVCADAVVEARRRAFLGLAEPSVAQPGPGSAQLERVSSC